MSKLTTDGDHKSLDSLKATGNSIPLWVERDSRPVAWGIGHWALVTSSPCPIPHAQKLHPLVGGVFYCVSTDYESQILVFVSIQYKI